MIPFRTENGAVFRCQIDPSWTNYANLNFHAAQPDLLPFHLSLRLTAGFAVVNRKDKSGWHREHHIPAAFGQDRFAVELRFEDRAVTVHIAGTLAGRFTSALRIDRQAPLLLGRGFPDLQRITHCSADGAVPWETIETRDRTFDRLWHSVTPASGLVLTDRLELAERFADPLQPARHAVLLPGGDRPIPLLPASADLETVPNTFALPKGVAAILIPGRIWIDTPRDQPAAITVLELATGAKRPAISITRHDLIQRLMRLTGTGAVDHDDLAALQAIEHCRYAGIWPDLPAPAQQALKAAAARLRLAAFLAADNAPAAEPPPARPAPSPVAGLTADLSRLLATTTDPKALSDWLAQTLRSLPEPEVESLALALCPTFCDLQAFDSLFQAIRGRGLFPIRPWDDVGYVSLTLPFQLLDGQYDQVINRLHWLADRHGGWLVTTALGWMARRLAQPGDLPLPEAKRQACILGFCAILTAQAQDAWGRAPCHAMMDGLLALIAELPRLPPDTRARLQSCALAAYGLSPRFWSALGTHATAPMLSGFAPGLLAGAAAFADLADPSRRALALATLARLGCVAAPAAALDLMPPDQLRQQASWHPDLLLRDLFQPGSTKDPDFDVRAAIARSLPRVGRVPATSPFAGLERQLGETAFGLLTDWAGLDAATRLARLQPCLTDALALSGAQADHVGLAVSLGMLLALADDAAAQDLILAHLQTVRATAIHAPHSLGMAPALGPVLQRLAAHPRLADRVAQTLGLALPPAQPGPATPGAADALFNTVVVVMSCRPNLDSRIKTLRNGWLADLGRIGIPHIVVVGEGRQTGGPQAGPLPPDVVALAAPDDYEGLPQKSLAAFAHVQTHFPGRRLLKIDDDCFLDVAEYFFSLSFLKADYYGRPLARARGQMDRTWHMEKSTSARGRHDLDKSPEPATYADGGSGYLLTPRAIDALLHAARTAEGQRLVQASFMEDKLIGDLLAMSGIALSGKDYRVHILRRTRPGGRLVPKWENACLPFAGSGVKLAHLDGDDLQAQAALVAKGKRPATGKIWSSLAPARLGAQSNALDLLSPPDRLTQARHAAVAVVACLRNEVAFLPRFLAHYRSLGVDSFLIADNGSDDGSVEYLFDQPDVALFSVDSDYNQSHYGVLWQQALMSAYRPDRWTLIADADELLVWTPDAKGHLPDLLAGPEFRDCDAARIFMLDMYPQGPLSGTDFADQAPFDAAPFVDRQPFLTSSLGRGPFSNARTFTSATRHRLLPGSRAELFVAQKIALLRYQPWMRLSDGLHYVAETRLSRRSLLFGHFKYNAAFRAKALTEVARGQHFNNAEEYRKYLDLLSEGRETIFDPAVSVCWTDSPFVQTLLATGQPPD